MLWGLLLPLAAASACGGPILTNGSTERVRVDPLAYSADGGALFSYVQPAGQLKVTVSWKDGIYTLAAGSKADIVPDYDRVFHVHYHHVEPFDDKITFSTDENGLLKKVSSTSTDQTVAVISSINEILSQSAAAASALQKRPEQKMTAERAKPAKAVCKNASYIFHVELTRPHSREYHADAGGCPFSLNAEIVRLTALNMASDGGAGEHVTNCTDVVCFRVLGLLKVVLRSNGHELTVHAVAPMGDRYGFIRLDRRAFVSNDVEADFTNGILTSFSASDPSQVIGFLKLPLEVLKSVPILVKF
jgi:hypothetical protein